MWLIALKKYWKIFIIILVAIFILSYYVLFRKKDIEDIASDEAVSNLKEGITEIKERIQEANNTAIVETAVAKKDLLDIKKELNNVSKIKDIYERRNKLSELATRSENY